MVVLSMGKGVAGLRAEAMMSTVRMGTMRVVRMRQW